MLSTAVVGLCLATPAHFPLSAQTPRRSVARLEKATLVQFPSVVDSNSPAFWQSFRGQRRLAVLNSAPTPVLSTGSEVGELDVVQTSRFWSETNGARWMEAVVPDAPVRLYGYYHNEPTGVCDDPAKTAPRIGAARSFDGGRSWMDLGIVIQSPGIPDCGTPNRYFAGGVGDFSVMLDPAGRDLYFLFSSYGPDVATQGVSVARMLWADRDKPVGRVAIWVDGVWRYPGAAAAGTLSYPAPTPILPVQTSWHTRRGQVDAYWGPSVHWNTHINQYVMLLNRAHDETWGQEGIYLSTTTTLDDPRSWTPPQRLLAGGFWYPQVIGLEPGSGTDKLAGERARFFMGGMSEYEIVFDDPVGQAVPRR
jgi:hypothetical protein